MKRVDELGVDRTSKRFLPAIRTKFDDLGELEAQVEAFRELRI